MGGECFTRILQRSARKKNDDRIRNGMITKGFSFRLENIFENSINSNCVVSQYNEKRLIVIPKMALK
jgi:hypothetical protein